MAGDNDGGESKEEARGAMPTTQATTTIGGLGPFDVTSPEKWETYLWRYETFCEANRITESNIQRATLLTMGGQELFEAALSVISPKKIKEVTYKDLVSKLTTHFMPVKSVYKARFDFCKRQQGPDESAQSFMAALQKLSNECKFGTLLESMLITQFIIGLREEAVQRRLWQEKESTITKQYAVELAATSESAKSQQKEIRDEKVFSVEGEEDMIGSVEMSREELNDEEDVLDQMKVTSPVSSFEEEERMQKKIEEALQQSMYLGFY